MLERIKFLSIGLVFPFLFAIARFAVNQGDYTQHEWLLIILCMIVLTGGIRYGQKNSLVSIRTLTRKEWIQVILFLFVEITFICLYSSLFQVSSEASSSFSEKRANGYSISFILGVTLFGPIEEELVMRGFIQKGFFQNSVLGLLLTSSLFAFFHGPSDLVAFLFYMFSGIIFGLSYKMTDNLLVPILIHLADNSFVMISSLF